MACKLRRILKKGLCANDLNLQVVVYVRRLQSTGFDGLNSNISNLVKVGDFMTGVETINPISRQFLKGVDERVSHLFYFMFSSRLEKLSQGEAYIKLRGHLYRVRGVLNHNEDNRFFVFYAEYRGEENEKEAKV